VWNWSKRRSAQRPRACNEEEHAIVLGSSVPITRRHPPLASETAWEKRWGRSKAVREKATTEQLLFIRALPVLLLWIHAPPVLLPHLASVRVRLDICAHRRSLSHHAHVVPATPNGDMREITPERGCSSCRPFSTGTCSLRRRQLQLPCVAMRALLEQSKSSIPSTGRGLTAHCLHHHELQT
jgi:hypothetical protein